MRGFTQIISYASDPSTISVGLARVNAFITERPHVAEFLHHSRRSGLRVSPFCLGAMTFGEDLGSGSGSAPAWKSPNPCSHPTSSTAGTFSTLPTPTRAGTSEKIIGDFFRQRKGSRDRVVIATKFFMNLFAGDPNGGGAGRKAMVAQCEESLRRLQTDYIDLYYIHNWDRFTPIEETMTALDDLVKSGKVRYIGISDAPAWKVAQAQLIAHFSAAGTPLIALQIEYSLMERTVEGELTPMAQGARPWRTSLGTA